jgi:hypothetical protein
VEPNNKFNCGPNVEYNIRTTPYQARRINQKASKTTRPHIFLLIFYFYNHVDILMPFLSSFIFFIKKTECRIILWFPLWIEGTRAMRIGAMNQKRPNFAQRKEMMTV